MYADRSFGARLREVRTAQRISAYALAKRVGVTEAAIRSWEAGRTAGPSLVVGLRIADALCEDPLFLAFGTETPTGDFEQKVVALEGTLAAIEARVAVLERE